MDITFDPIVMKWIAEHKSKCKLKNDNDAVASLIQLATLDYPEKIRELKTKLEDALESLREIEKNKEDGE